MAFNQYFHGSSVRLQCNGTFTCTSLPPPPPSTPSKEINKQAAYTNCPRG